MAGFVGLRVGLRSSGVGLGWLRQVWGCFGSAHKLWLQRGFRVGLGLVPGLLARGGFKVSFHLRFGLG